MICNTMESLAEFGYLGLFAASFLAATILPLSSEVVLTYLLAHNFHPATLITVATTGNVLGSFANYGIGFWGSIFLLQGVLRISAEDFASSGAPRFAALPFMVWVRRSASFACPSFKYVFTFSAASE